jgi:uncharacterized protein YggE
MQPNTSFWGTKEGVFKAIVVVAGLMSLFLFVLSVDQIRRLFNNNEIASTQISISGEGEIIAIPDVATFTFTVTENAKTVEVAQDAAAKKIDAALKAVRGLGAEERDIKTVGYNVAPRYEWEGGVCNAFGCPNGKNVLKGYDVTQSIEVKIRDTKKVGAMLSAVGTAGIQNVSGVSFTIDDIDSVRDNARELAIEDAKARAEALSKSLGVKIVRVIGYWEDMPYTPAYDYSMDGRDMMMAKSVTPEIPTGEQKVTSKVNVSFEIR